MKLKKKYRKQLKKLGNPTGTIIIFEKNNCYVIEQPKQRIGFI